MEIIVINYVVIVQEVNVILKVYVMEKEIHV